MGLCHSVSATRIQKGRIIAVDEIEANNKPMIAQSRIMPVGKSPAIQPQQMYADVQKEPDIARIFGI
jgi:hypothetical protein